MKSNILKSPVGAAHVFTTAHGQIDTLDTSTVGINNTVNSRVTLPVVGILADGSSLHRTGFRGLSVPACPIRIQDIIGIVRQEQVGVRSGKVGPSVAAAIVAFHGDPKDTPFAFGMIVRTVPVACKYDEK